MTYLIFGAGGHALEILALAQRTGALSGDPAEAMFVVADRLQSKKRTDLPYRVISEAEAFHLGSAQPFCALLAFGSSHIRKSLVQKMERLQLPVRYPNLIDSSALVLSELEEDSGVVLFPQVTISVRVSVGQHVHVNTLASVSHESRIGDYATISPGVVVCGQVEVGDEAFLGAGCTIIDGASVPSSAVIGAGAVVLSGLSDKGTYTGVPARRQSSSAGADLEKKADGMEEDQL